MGAVKRITIRLPEEVVQAADEAATRQGCSRSELIREVLRWHTRVRVLAVAEPSSAEQEALAAGRAQHAGGDFATIDEIRRDLAADLRAERKKKSAKASA